jgi:YbgC/YbaW family acyl-CoA thioester hydrolase
MAKTYRCPIEVRGYELDGYGHVNHANYFHYLEQARWKMLDEEQITHERMQEWKRWPVVAEIENAKYLRPTFRGDQLSVETRISEATRTSFRIEQKIHRGSEVVFEARIRAVIINENGRPSEMPDEFKRIAAAGAAG